MIAIALEKGTGKRARSAGFVNARLVEISVWKVQAMHLAVLGTVIIDERRGEGLQDASGVDKVIFEVV